MGGHRSAMYLQFALAGCIYAGALWALLEATHGASR